MNKKIVSLGPYLAFVGFLGFIYLYLWNLPPQCVGDGSEYYALLISWSETIRPWLSQPAFCSYETLHSIGQINGLVPREWLEGAFPHLKLMGTTDFNHF